MIISEKIHSITCILELQVSIKFSLLLNNKIKNKNYSSYSTRKFYYFRNSGYAQFFNMCIFISRLFIISISFKYYKDIRCIITINKI